MGGRQSPSPMAERTKAKELLLVPAVLILHGGDSHLSTSQMSHASYPLAVPTTSAVYPHDGEGGCGSALTSRAA